MYFLPKIKIELALPEEMVEQAIDAICKSAYTGKIGDGKIFVYNLDQVIRVRTGEIGKDADRNQNRLQSKHPAVGLQRVGSTHRRE